MGFSLGPALVNIIITELEDVIIKPLIADDTIKFYSHVFDETLLVMKPENVDQANKALDNNLRFTVDMLQNQVLYLLGLKLLPDGIKIFQKNTNTPLYLNFTSFVPWAYCPQWTRGLVTRASRVCLTDKLRSEINIIKRFASWNGFPKSVVNSIINKTLNTPSITADSNNADEINNGVTFYFCIPYYTDKRLFINKSLHS